MLNELGCWEVNWTAIGAVLTGIGSIAAVVTAGIALYIGLEPRRIQGVREIRLAGVAASVLQREVGVLRSTGYLLASVDYNIKELAQEETKTRMRDLLQYPLLLGCVERACEYPEGLAYEMGDLCGVASVFELRLRGFGRQDVLENDVAQLKELAFTLAQCADRLQSLLLTYTPAIKRSVSPIPAGTPESVQTK